MQYRVLLLSVLLSLFLLATGQDPGSCRVASPLVVKPIIGQVVPPVTAQFLNADGTPAAYTQVYMGSIRGGTFLCSNTSPSGGLIMPPYWSPMPNCAGEVIATDSGGFTTLSYAYANLIVGQWALRLYAQAGSITWVSCLFWVQNQPLPTTAPPITTTMQLTTTPAPTTTTPAPTTTTPAPTTTTPAPTTTITVTTVAPTTTVPPTTTHITTVGVTTTVMNTTPSSTSTSIAPTTASTSTTANIVTTVEQTTTQEATTQANTASSSTASVTTSPQANTETIASSAPATGTPISSSTATGVSTTSDSTPTTCPSNNFDPLSPVGAHPSFLLYLSLRSCIPSPEGRAELLLSIEASAKLCAHTLYVWNYTESNCSRKRNEMEHVDEGTAKRQTVEAALLVIGVRSDSNQMTASEEEKQLDMAAAAAHTVDSVQAATVRSNTVGHESSIFRWWVWALIAFGGLVAVLIIVIVIVVVWRWRRAKKAPTKYELML